MAKGENIFKRKDGRWEARYCKGYDLAGKIKYGFCYGKSYREAKGKALACKAALQNGTQPLPSKNARTPLAEYCDAWLTSRRMRIKETTAVKYDTILTQHIKPLLGKCPIQSFRTPLIDAFSAQLLQEQLAPKTVRDILAVLRSVLQYAAELCPGILPEIAGHYPKQPRQEMRVLTREEMGRFSAYLQSERDACKFGVLLAMFTGLRIGELCALRWQDIDLQERTVHVRQTLQRLRCLEEGGDRKTKIVIGPPKSDTSVRAIPLTDYAVCLCRRMCPVPTGHYVLTGTDRYMEPRTLQYRLEKYTKACGLQDVHFHTLRHTFATRAVEAGFELKSLSEVLGHATTSITLDRYVHSSMELKRDNMEKLTAVGL